MMCHQLELHVAVQPKPNCPVLQKNNKETETTRETSRDDVV
jgi:hypothetical protein